MAKPNKERLDKELVARELVPTRAKAQALIMAGEVKVNGDPVSKAGHGVTAEDEIELAKTVPYVSRGGFKLAGALDRFEIDVTGRDCADVGACTGGFTDVLLQRGAGRVIAIDVGYGQLDWRLRQSEQVTVIERTNVRYLETVPHPVDLVVIDVSFISLTLVLPAIQRWLTPPFDIVALIKPQFEAGREQVGKGGIIRDTAVHAVVLEKMLDWTETNGLYVHGLIPSPIKGTEGNREFLVWLKAVQNLDWEKEAHIQAVLY